MLEGKVLWYDTRDGKGVIVDSGGNEYYVSSDVIGSLKHLDRGDLVTFERNTKIVGTACACNVKRVDETPVVFRKWKDGGSILALFPTLNDSPDGCCMSYQHIGQHGAADYNHCIRMTVPAKPEEYKALQAELTQIGYNLKVIIRYQPKKGGL